MLVCNLRARSGIEIWPMEECASTPCYSVRSTERSSILRGLLRKGWLADAVKHQPVSVAIEAKLASVGFETDSWASGGMCMSGYIHT